MQVGTTRGTHYSTTSHLVWIPNERRKVLTNAGEKATKELITECCERHGLTRLALETAQDHVQVPVLVSAPPRFAPAEMANLLTGNRSRYLRERFPPLKRMCGKDPLWTQSYYVGTAGSVSAETLRRSIMDCQGQ